ncbi:MAG: hypothetical protein JWR11_876 [Mycobacterium sp.]|nr:hypothetical protein [Mycobacterium sp.]
MRRLVSVLVGLVIGAVGGRQLLLHARSCAALLPLMITIIVIVAGPLTRGRHDVFELACAAYLFTLQLGAGGGGGDRGGAQLMVMRASLCDGSDSVPSRRRHGSQPAANERPAKVAVLFSGSSVGVATLRALLLCRSKAPDFDAPEVAGQGNRPSGSSIAVWAVAPDVDGDENTPPSEVGQDADWIGRATAAC